MNSDVNEKGPRDVAKCGCWGPLWPSGQYGGYSGRLDSSWGLFSSCSQSPWPWLGEDQWPSRVLLICVSLLSRTQNCYDLLVRKKRLIVLFSHWLLHAYGIVSISRADRLEHDLPLLALVPTPALFYLFTAKFTEPSRILSEGANGHWIYNANKQTKPLKSILNKKKCKEEMKMY